MEMFTKSDAYWCGDKILGASTAKKILKLLYGSLYASEGLKLGYRDSVSDEYYCDE